jgi:hypothetical protein
MPRSSNTCIPSRFSAIILYEFLIPSHSFYTHSPPNSPWFHHPNNMAFDDEYKLWSPSLCNSFYLVVIFSFSDPHIPLTSRSQTTKAMLFLCLINYGSRDEGVWGSEATATCILNLDTGWNWPVSLFPFKDLGTNRTETGRIPEPVWA